MLDFIKNFVEEFLAVVQRVLPTSPFQPYISELEELPYLNYLNWFIPVGTILNICAAWLVSVGLFYMYSIILRWIRAID